MHSFFLGGIQLCLDRRDAGSTVFRMDPVYGPFQNALSTAGQVVWKLMFCSSTEQWARASQPGLGRAQTVWPKD